MTKLAWWIHRYNKRGRRKLWGIDLTLLLALGAIGVLAASLAPRLLRRPPHVSPITETRILPSGAPLKIHRITRTTFPDGSTGLVLLYETDKPITDVTALAAEADEIWPVFQSDVEKAGVDAGLIRAGHYNRTTGMVRQGPGLGCIFRKNAAGVWRRVQGEPTP